jgi:hypothetical protein
MIFVGLDDTDMPDTPGTNKLAFHLTELLDGDYATQWIVRHQLLVDPRIPCTNRNGCVTMALEPRSDELSRGELLNRVRAAILAWCPTGSDPGLCIADQVAPEIAAWGKAAQIDVLLKEDALRLASETGVHLEELGGTGGGVIGRLQIRREASYGRFDRPRQTPAAQSAQRSRRALRRARDAG